MKTNKYHFRALLSSAECDPTLPQAEGCAILTSKMLVTSVGVSVADVHRDILEVLADGFRENVLIEFLPELLSTSYLGPDLDAIALSSSGTEESGEASGSNSSVVAAVLFSVFFAVLGAYFAFPMIGKIDVNKVISFYMRRRHKPLPTCSGPAREEHDGDYNEPLAICNGTTEG